MTCIGPLLRVVVSFCCFQVALVLSNVMICKSLARIADAKVWLVSNYWLYRLGFCSRMFVYLHTHRLRLRTLTRARGELAGRSNQLTDAHPYNSSQGSP